MTRFSEIVTFKEGVDKEEIFMLTPKMLLLLGAFTEYAYVRDLPVNITCMQEYVASRVTRTHLEGRAVDISVKGWSLEEINEAVTVLSIRHRIIAAFSERDGKPRAVIYHNVEGWHFHLQVRP